MVCLQPSNSRLLCKIRTKLVVSYKYGLRPETERKHYKNTGLEFPLGVGPFFLYIFMFVKMLAIRVQNKLKQEH